MLNATCARPSALRAVVPSLALALAALAFNSGACGGDTVDPNHRPCTRSRDCLTGEACVDLFCKAVPCGGCDVGQVCVDPTCVPAQGATCPATGCPTGYSCSAAGNVCNKVCVVDRDCDTGTVCNSGACVQCVFDSQCTTVAGKPRCEPTKGQCVACLEPIDCTRALGSGNYCEASTHTCAPGCKVDGDCNLSQGEICNGATATTPGKCVQCRNDGECNLGAPACDPTGHCVACTEDKYCTPGAPRCDGTTKTCVKCLPANDASGTDCGYNFPDQPGVPAHMDPHNALVCDATAKQCVVGCKVDANCGCPVKADGKPTDCPRRWTQERCDPNKTAMDGIVGPTQGACVECNVNADCKCLVKGNETKPECVGNPRGGSLNGAQCDAPSAKCVVGCDADADCPANRLCSLTGATAHTCVECSCLNKTVYDANLGFAGWCNDPSNGFTGCGVASGGVQLVCDADTNACRKKRQSESCSTYLECGDPHDPKTGLCIPNLAICVFSSVPYAGSPRTYCAPGKNTGRCGIACVDNQTNTCTQDPAYCPTNTQCRSALEDNSHLGKYCVPVQGPYACSNP